MRFSVKILDFISHLNFTTGGEQETKKLSGKLVEDQRRTLLSTKTRKLEVIFLSG